MSKNIYILPTDKFQNIKLSLFENKLYLGDIASTALPQHIYITSDEEIKEGDWVICLENIFKNEIFKVDSDVPNKSCNVTLEFAKKYLTKIILTTDQDLIKDGVQEITEEFLEWFVKNPNCEFVETLFHYPTICDEGDYSLNLGYLTIIIPKEEPKQETLEEATEKFSKQFLNNGDNSEFEAQAALLGVKFGAKWQAERMYSEEDIKNLIKIIEWYDNESDVRPNYNEKIEDLTMWEWFEQFKKK